MNNEHHTLPHDHHFCDRRTEYNLVIYYASYLMSESRVCEDPFATPFRVPHAENGLHWGHKIMLSVVLYQTRWEDELRVIAVMRGFYVVMWLRGGSIRTVVRLVVGTRQALRVFGSSRSIFCEYQGRLACSIELRNSPSIWKRTELLMRFLFYRGNLGAKMSRWKGAE